MKTIKQLQEQNKKLEQKLHKYENTIFFPFFLVSLFIIYVLCILVGIDDVIYTSFSSKIPNSIICTIMGGIITGSMIGMCKLEYKKAINKIKKQIEKNKIKIKNYINNSNELNHTIEIKKDKEDKLLENNQLEKNILEKYSLEIIPTIDINQIKKTMVKKRVSK